MRGQQERSALYSQQIFYAAVDRNVFGLEKGRRINLNLGTNVANKITPTHSAVTPPRDTTRPTMSAVLSFGLLLGLPMIPVKIEAKVGS